MLYDTLYSIRAVLGFGGLGYFLIAGLYYSFQRDKHGEDTAKRKRIEKIILIHVGASTFLATFGLALEYQSLDSPLPWLFTLSLCSIIPTLLTIISFWVVLYFTARAKESKKLGNDL